MGFSEKPARQSKKRGQSKLLSDESGRFAPGAKESQAAKAMSNRRLMRLSRFDRANNFLCSVV